MSRWGSAALAFALTVLLIGGVTAISRQRLEDGSLYGAYSSLNAGPEGTQALYESLARLPGFAVRRGLRPLTELGAQPQLVLLAGMSDAQWRDLDDETVAALDRAADAGSRVVVAFRARGNWAAAAPPEPGAKPVVPAAIKRWGAELNAAPSEPEADHRARAVKGAGSVPASLPLKGESTLKLAADQGWRIIYRWRGEPVVAECPRGLGTLVICADSFPLTNDALANDRQPRFLSWLVGSAKAAEFDETHLGIAEDPGIAALGRRYGLTAAAILLIGLAALFIWRKMALFIPAAPEDEAVAAEYAPTAGLESLLRRAIPPDQLMAACLAEWVAAGRPGGSSKSIAAVNDPAPSPVHAYNAQRAALRRG